MHLRRRITVVFLVYVLFIVAYFVLQPHGVPDRLAGTPADPRTFLHPQELDIAECSSWVRESYAFIYPVLSCYVMFWIWSSGIVSRWADRLTEKLSSRGLAVFLSLLTAYVLLRVVLLPVRFVYYIYRSRLGLTEQPIVSWLSDRWTDILVGVCTEFIAILAIWFLFRTFRRNGWLILSGLCIPLVFLFVYAKPVWIDPLYNHYAPLPDNGIKAQILSLADKAGVPAQDVYVSNVSKQTTTINAFVTGVGPSLRIVVWDTALQKLNEGELLSMLAHEMGHYKLHHVLRGTVYAIAGAFAFFAVLGWIWRLYRRRKGTDSPNDFALLMTLALLLLFLSNPIESRLSYGIEKQADDFAAELLHDPASSIGLHQKLAKYDKSDISESWLDRFFYGDHPTIRERIEEDMKRLQSQQ